MDGRGRRLGESGRRLEAFVLRHVLPAADDEGDLLVGRLVAEVEDSLLTGARPPARSTTSARGAHS